MLKIGKYLLNEGRDSLFIPPFSENMLYEIGDIVSYRGNKYRCLFNDTRGQFNIYRWENWLRETHISSKNINSKIAYFHNEFYAELDETLILKMENFEFSWDCIVNSIPEVIGGDDYGNVIVGTHPTTLSQYGIRVNKTQQNIQIARRDAGIPEIEGDIVASFDISFLSDRLDDLIRFYLKSKKDEVLNKFYLELSYSEPEGNHPVDLIELKEIDENLIIDYLPISHIGNNVENSRPCGKLGHLYFRGGGSEHYYPLAEGGTDYDIIGSHPIYDVISGKDGVIHGSTVWADIVTNQSYPFNYGYDEVKSRDRLLWDGNPRIVTDYTFQGDFKVDIDLSRTLSLNNCGDLVILNSSVDNSSNDMVMFDSEQKLWYNERKGTYLNSVGTASDRDILYNTKGAVISAECLTINPPSYTLRISVNGVIVASENRPYWSRNFTLKYIYAGLSGINNWYADYSIAPTLTVYDNGDFINPVIKTSSDSLNNTGSSSSLVTLTEATSEIITLSSYRILFNLNGIPQNHGLLESEYTRYPFNDLVGNFPLQPRVAHTQPFDIASDDDSVVMYSEVTKAGVNTWHES